VATRSAMKNQMASISTMVVDHGEPVTSPDLIEAMASFGPYVESSPAFIGWAFFALINADLTEETVAKLRSVVTPESIPQWGDFGES
jgi:hypothetical protein